jgi:hypothetical protein
VGGTKAAEVDPIYCILLFSICASFGVVSSFFIKENLKKYEYSLKKKAAKKVTIEILPGNPTL